MSRASLLKWLVVPTVAAVGLGLWVWLADSVQLSGVGMGKRSVVVVEGRRNVCFGYQGKSGATAWFWNIVKPQGCASEIIAFADGNGMAIDAEPHWTDSWGDVLPVAMGAQPIVPIDVFIMTEDWATGTIAGRMFKAGLDITRAIQTYGDALCGVTFASRVVKDVHAANFSSTLAFEGCTGNVPALRAIDPASTSKGGVSVFYNDGPAGLAGETCVDSNSAVIVLTQSATNETLGHELGHALSLKHSNGMPGIQAENLMLSPAPDPAILTLGQCFRTNVNEDSLVNLGGFRVGPKRSCPDTADSSECMKLSFP